MLVSLLFLGLIFGVALRQSSQGLFSSLIMAVLTICCAALALGTFEWVGAHWLASVVGNWKPDYTLPISLAALFGVPLILLRLLFDRLIRRAVLLPMLVDRIGSGICALIAAVTMVGIAAICLQMVPFQNGSILGFARVSAVDPAQHIDTTPPPPDEAENGLLFGPDRFATIVVAVLSDGVFSSVDSFVETHPNLVQTVGWVNAAHAEISRYAPPKSISVVQTDPVELVYDQTNTSGRNEPTRSSYNEQRAQSGHQFRMIRVRLHNEAKDKRKSLVFTLRQFRLVGREDPGSPMTQFHPIAIQQADESAPINRHIRAQTKGRNLWPSTHELYAPRRDNNGEVEIVFELPVGFIPSFIEYKHGARALVRFKEDDSVDTARTRRTSAPRATPVAAAKPRETSSDDSAGSGRSSRRRRSRGNGNAAGSNARVKAVSATGGATFGDSLPMTLTSYREINDVEITRRSLTRGHLVGSVGDQESGSNRPVERFDVPADKRLLHLSTVQLQARSGLGRALSSAVQVAQNYFVDDDKGRRYQIVGKYAVATVGGGRTVEVIYFRDPVGSIGGMGKFSRINEKKLTSADVYALLFLVDPGARIVRFSTGGSATRADDLIAQHIVAPD